MASQETAWWKSMAAMVGVIALLVVGGLVLATSYPAATPLQGMSVVSSSTTVALTTTYDTTATTTTLETSTLSATTASSAVNQTYGPGLISTFPASWDNPCGFAVTGNKTTVNDVNSSPMGANINLSQVYSKIVNSSDFQTLAAGRTWVTIQWSIFQSSNQTGSYDVVAGGFLFLVGSMPDPGAYAQVDYFVGSGEVTVAYTGPIMSSCPTVTNSSSSADPVGNDTNSGSAAP